MGAPNTLGNPFLILPLTKAGIRISSEIYREFELFYSKMEKLVPSGREASIMKTKLQEACNWSVEAIAILPVYQRTDFMEPETVAQPQVPAAPSGDLPLAPTDGQGRE